METFKMPTMKKTLPTTLISKDIFGVQPLTEYNSNINSYLIEHFPDTRRGIVIKTPEEQKIYDQLLKTNDVINEFRVFNKENFTIDEFLHEVSSIKSVKLNGKHLDVEEYKRQQEKEIIERFTVEINRILNQYREGDFIVFFDCITHALSGHASYVLIRDFEIIDGICMERS
jgi:hypothetical protein